MLHTVNKSPFEKSALQSCLAHARDGSAVLLIEDAVYAAVDGNPQENLLCAALQRLKIYALAPDLNARGMPVERLIEGIDLVDYAGFVELAVEHDNVQSWL